MAMLAKDYIAKMYKEHPELPEKIAEMERLYGAKVENKCMAIKLLLKG